MLNSRHLRLRAVLTYIDSHREGISRIFHLSILPDHPIVNSTKGVPFVEMHFSYFLSTLSGLLAIFSNYNRVKAYFHLTSYYLYLQLIFYKEKRFIEFRCRFHSNITRTFHARYLRETSLSLNHLFYFQHDRVQMPRLYQRERTSGSVTSVIVVGIFRKRSLSLVRYKIRKG